MTFTWGPVGTPLPHMKPADSRFHNPKSSDSNWDRTSDWTIVGPSLAVLDEKLSDESVIARFDRLNQDFLPESPGVVVVNFDHQTSHSYGLRRSSSSLRASGPISASEASRKLCLSRLLS